MKIRPDLERKVEETLDSLDGIQRATPRPYFYTRVMARLQRDEKTIWETIGSYLARPAVAVAALCFILVFNAVLLIRQDSSTANTVSPVISSSEVLSTDNEYILASSSSFEYENIDPVNE
jgi:hypothetical protein